jgi:hypothetical protein
MEAIDQALMLHEDRLHEDRDVADLAVYDEFATSA